MQLSFPCNYNAAGKALGIDLLNNPEWISEKDDLAVKTAVWFFQENNVITPARQGNFSKTTELINGKQECNSGPQAHKQTIRIETYKRVRTCFHLGEPSGNLKC